jgi:hypothetical protein
VFRSHTQRAIVVGVLTHGRHYLRTPFFVCFFVSHSSRATTTNRLCSALRVHDLTLLPSLVDSRTLIRSSLPRLRPVHFSATADRVAMSDAMDESEYGAIEGDISASPRNVPPNVTVYLVGQVSVHAEPPLSSAARSDLTTRRRFSPCCAGTENCDPRWHE